MQVSAVNQTMNTFARATCSGTGILVLRRGRKQRERGRKKKIKKNKEKVEKRNKKRKQEKKEERGRTGKKEGEGK